MRFGGPVSVGVRKALVRFRVDSLKTSVNDSSNSLQGGVRQVIQNIGRLDNMIRPVPIQLPSFSAVVSEASESYLAPIVRGQPSHAVTDSAHADAVNGLTNRSPPTQARASFVNYSTYRRVVDIMCPTTQPSVLTKKGEVDWTLRGYLQENLISGLTDEETGAQLSTVRYREDSRGLTEIESKEVRSRRLDPLQPVSRRVGRDCLQLPLMAISQLSLLAETLACGNASERVSGLRRRWTAAGPASRPQTDRPDRVRRYPPGTVIPQDRN
jgi:hypothetical protein